MLCVISANWMFANLTAAPLSPRSLFTVYKVSFLTIFGFQIRSRTSCVTVSTLLSGHIS